MTIPTRLEKGQTLRSWATAHSFWPFVVSLGAAMVPAAVSFLVDVTTNILGGLRPTEAGTSVTVESSWFSHRFCHVLDVQESFLKVVPAPFPLLF